jgi:hypothetical protein
MTLYTRGYRPYGAGFDAKGPRFLPILGQGWRLAVRGKAFVFLTVGFVITAIITSVLLYVQAGLENVLRIPGFVRGESPFEASIAALETMVVNSLWAPDLLTTLMVMFVGSGLISEDLKARALPLYLVRPITPFDYYLGKILVPISVAAATALSTLLFMVLFGALLQPSEHMASFLGRQTKLLSAILVWFLAAAVSYSSLVILCSATTSRRIAANVLAAVVLFGGGMVRVLFQHGSGAVVDVIRSLSLPSDATALFLDRLGRSTPTDLPLPSPSAALFAVLGVTAAAAVLVLRRARTVEVVA